MNVNVYPWGLNLYPYLYSLNSITWISELRISDFFLIFEYYLISYNIYNETELNQILYTF